MASDYFARSSSYRRIFRGVVGPGPYTCYFCHEEIDATAKPLSKRALAIHHLDHDRANSAPSNLVPTHCACHAIYHAAEGKHRLAAQRRAEREARQAVREARMDAIFDHLDFSVLERGIKAALAAGHDPEEVLSVATAEIHHLCPESGCN